MLLPKHADGKTVWFVVICIVLHTRHFHKTIRSNWLKSGDCGFNIVFINRAMASPLGLWSEITEPRNQQSNERPDYKSNGLWWIIDWPPSRTILSRLVSQIAPSPFNHLHSAVLQSKQSLWFNELIYVTVVRNWKVPTNYGTHMGSGLLRPGLLAWRKPTFGGFRMLTCLNVFIIERPRAIGEALPYRCPCLEKRRLEGIHHLHEVLQGWRV